MVTEGSIKTPEQIVSMKLAGEIVAKALISCKKILKGGVTTKEIDNFLRTFIEKEVLKENMDYLIDKFYDTGSKFE